MKIKDNVNLPEIKTSLADIYDSIYRIEEYGHVGHYDIKEEDMKNQANKILEHLKIAEEELCKICKDIKDNYEY